MIRIGTCSWKYDSWRGIVYPETGKLNHLAEYSKSFNTVEIDQWFWSLFGREQVRLPVEKAVKEYNESVDEDFRFTIKVPNSLTLTHFYSNRASGKRGVEEPNPWFLSPDLFNRFLDSIQPLHSKTGVLMFQFGYLNKQKMGSLPEFLNQLGTFFREVQTGLPIAVELRNPNYLKMEYFEFLKEHQIANVFIQGYYMPDITGVYSIAKKFLRDLAVFRLMGPDRKGIEKRTGEKWDRIVDPKDGELNNIAEMLIDLESRGIKVFANINNHYEGSAPLTIKKLQELLSESQ